MNKWTCGRANAKICNATVEECPHAGDTQREEDTMYNVECPRTMGEVQCVCVEETDEG